MTIRQRQATGSATAAIANGADTGADRSLRFSWEDWFQHASTQQRAEALTLAGRQGVLYPHQLAATSNGVKPPAAPSQPTAASAALTQLLSNKSDRLAAPHIDALTFVDAQLDGLQQQAVARAVATPDIFMLHGLPGTGKTRVLAEIVLQLAMRGKRILFLARHTSSLDVVLQRLVDRPETLPLRQLDAGEKPEMLPACLRAFTLQRQQQAFLEGALVGARASHAAADAACRQRRDTEPLWNDLKSSLQHWHDVDARLRDLDAELAGLSATVDRQADATGAVAARIADLRQDHDGRLRQLEISLRTEQAALAQSDEQIGQIAAQIAQRDSAYQAKKHGRFWTLSFWLNLFNGRIIEEMETLLAQQSAATARRLAVAQEVDRLDADRSRERARFAAERMALVETEVAARQGILEKQRQAMDDERARLDQSWRAACDRLGVDTIEKSPSALDAAQHTWLQQKTHDEQQCHFALHWTRFVEEKGPQLAAKLSSFANVLASSLRSWQADAKLRDASGTFDLLIVEDANALTEAELDNLARLAPRCVLVAPALAEDVPPTPTSDKMPRPSSHAAAWHRLWDALGGDANRWPFSWHRENGRLLCELFPLTLVDRQHLDCESLADSPEIELCIVHRPNTRPRLAQVKFAPHCPFEDAFRFILREVQEFPLQPVGRTAWWSETGQRHERHLGVNAARIHAWIDIEPGLRLGAVADEHGDATRIARIEFDKAAGWDRAKAEAWLQRHRPARDCERTAFLQSPYRFAAPLTALVRSIVRADDWLPCSAPALPENPSSFEFVSVPPLERLDWPREGAGLELDLSAPRHAEHLPVGLRQGLPPRGFVNYLEAQALVRRLEAWASDHGAPQVQVAVLALFEGQVALLRKLIEQSESLRARKLALEVTLPSRMHQRECDAVFLSLTRSHSHRAVAFGEDANELPLAFTRSRGRLIVFGDPGALCKRVHWHGPLEHFDAHAAEQELLRLTRFLAHLQQPTSAAALANGATNGNRR